MNWPWLLQWRMSKRRYRLHWSLPLGISAAWLLWPAMDTVLGYLLVLLSHQAGHHLLGRRGGLETTGFDLHALGGSARFEGTSTRMSHVLAGAGGVLGQVALLWLVILIHALMGGGSEGDLHRALTTLNLGIMALNLIPAAATDGASLWALPRALLERLEERLTYMQIAEVEAQRTSWQKMIDRDSSNRVPELDSTSPPDLAEQLARRDAAADQGISDELALAVNRLVSSAWSSEE